VGACTAAACAQFECCADNNKCKADDCGTGFELNTTKTDACTDVTCTQAECCTAVVVVVANPKCELSDCGTGKVRNAKTSPCAALVCTEGECCDAVVVVVANPKCEPSDCGSGQTRNTFNGPCAAAVCLEGECCDSPVVAVTCAVFLQATPCDTRNFSPKSASSPCPAAVCKLEDCCVAHPRCGDAIDAMGVSTVCGAGFSVDPAKASTVCQGQVGSITLLLLSIIVCVCVAFFMFNHIAAFVKHYSHLLSLGLITLSLLSIIT
jgi:hypothetical protein